MEPLILLAIDDDDKILKSYRRLFRNQCYRLITVDSSTKGLHIVRSNPQIAVVLSDFSMPEMDGIEFLEKVKDENPDIIRLLITGFGSLKNSMDALSRSHIYEYILKPWDSDALLATVDKAFAYYNLIAENRKLNDIVFAQNKKLTRINNHLEDLVDERTSLLENALVDGVRMLAAAGEAKDDNTGEHILRVQSLTEKICLELGIDEKLSKKIALFSILHDVGKISIPDVILKKKGALSGDEWEVMKSHTIVGEKILCSSSFYEIASQIARWHHENWDGSGYPDGLKGTEIPLPARIVALVDVFDALSHDRPYKKKWPMDKIISEISNLKGIKFDPDVVGAFFMVLEKKDIMMGE